MASMHGLVSAFFRCGLVEKLGDEYFRDWCMGISKWWVEF